MESITLTRTGDRPLKFEGEEITTAGGRISGGQEQNRWHELSLYHTAGGKYVLSIEYRTVWQGEIDHAQVTTHGDAEDVTIELKTYSPTAHVIGFPLGDQYAEKQGRLMEGLRARYEAAVSELLASIEPEEIE